MGTAVLRLPRRGYPIEHRTLPRLPRRSRAHDADKVSDVQRARHLYWRPRLYHSLRDARRTSVMDSVDGVQIYEGYYTLRHDILRLVGRDSSEYLMTNLTTLSLPLQREGLLGIWLRNKTTLLSITTQSSNRPTTRRPASSQILFLCHRREGVCSSCH